MHSDCSSATNVPPSIMDETKFHSPISIPSSDTIPTVNKISKYNSLKQFRNRHREMLAEFLGTLIMVFLICGVCAEERLHINKQPSSLAGPMGSGLGVLVAIGISGHVSGAHMNPTVTMILCIYGKFPKSKAPLYILAQFLGSFVGSALLYWTIEPAITHFDGGTRQILGEFGTAGIFGTYPAPYVSIRSAILSEIMGTCLLILIILGSCHPSNTPFKSFQGVFVSLGVFSVCISIGYSSGFSINPVRDFGPRLFTAVAGWGFDVFTVHNYYAFVPLFSPFIGALLGGVIYSVFID